MVKESEKKEDKKEEGKSVADEIDIQILKKYGRGPYTDKIKQIEDESKAKTEEINKLCGIRESETGLALPSNWVIEQDKQGLKEDSLMIGRITKILDPNTDHTRYIVRIKRQSKFLVELKEELSPTDVEEGMRVLYYI